MKRLRTKFVYDHNDRPIGRVDEEGTLYTMQGNPSQPWVQTKIGPYPSASHIRRERAARNQLDAESTE